ncbi:GNA1162 family protein [Colwellia sp. C1TZA3]|uniref:GNA1162 family protein n=1 Tax=Colwellia sp. C1TZA3 TaxID=2508879 RepID=UPI0011B96C53|nr:GNA1162 family protein [Colwellia sp. C1TZA3]TWX72634.1 hypothetical protein ESZ39_07605 [Colwellia sp. C1TZA3]
MLKTICFALVVVIVSGCASPSYVTKIDEFPEMYNEKPRSLLIMPPINLSTAADAKAYYATTVEIPIAFQGYYTFPYELTTEILKQEGIYDAELVYDMPLGKFHEYFGADAVLFTKIVEWDTDYAVIASSLTVSIDAEIKSTKSSQTLWKYTGTVVVDLSGGNSGGGLAGLLVGAIVTAVNTAAADYTDYAKKANSRFVGTVPVGPYHPLYLKDQKIKVMQQMPKE